jgi:hypothetical protein
MSRQEEAQAGLDNFRRIWRTMIERQRNMTPAERAEQSARHKAEAKARMDAYRQELIAAKERECAAPVDVSFRLEQAGVEPQHRQGLRSGLDERHAFMAARRWWTQAKVATGAIRDVVDGNGGLSRQPVLVRRWPFLVLAGSSGKGKTQAAAWCLREAARAYPWNTGATGTNEGHRRPLVLWHGTAMASTALYGNHSSTVMDEAERQWEEATRASVLVLDDLFPRRLPMSGPHTDRLTALLTARHGAHRSTIITANMDAPTLAKLLDGQEAGGPLWRRVSEGGIVVTLQDKGLPTVLRGGAPADWRAK